VNGSFVHVERYQSNAVKLGSVIRGHIVDYYLFRRCDKNKLEPGSP
jgi:hypothetical protein